MELHHCSPGWDGIRVVFCCSTQTLRSMIDGRSCECGRVGGGDQTLHTRRVSLLGPLKLDASLLPSMEEAGPCPMPLSRWPLLESAAVCPEASKRRPLFGMR